MRNSLFFAVLSIFCVQCSESRRHKKNEGKTVDEVYSRVCLPRNTDRLVYRYQNDSHIFIGFDNLEKGKLFTISWEIKETNHEILEKSRTKTYFGHEEIQEFRSSLSADNILAATNSKHQRDFVKNVKDCQQSVLTKDCLIEAFAKSARRMKSVTFKKHCSAL